VAQLRSLPPHQVFRVSHMSGHAADNGSLIHPLASALATEAIERAAAQAVARNHFMSILRLRKSEGQCGSSKTVPNARLLSLNTGPMRIAIVPTVAVVDVPTVMHSG
jgi:hypothetical protein